MRFADCVDYGDANTEIVDGLAMVAEIDEDHIEIMHYRAHVMPDGSVENRIVSRHRWSKRKLAQAKLLFEEALATFERQKVERPRLSAVTH
jgi:hypothetical protein